MLRSSICSCCYYHCSLAHCYVCFLTSGFGVFFFILNLDYISLLVNVIILLVFHLLVLSVFEVIHIAFSKVLSVVPFVILGLNLQCYLFLLFVSVSASVLSIFLFPIS